MKPTGYSESVTATNGLGHDSTARHTHFEVEQRDVGVTRNNYGGYHHSSYTFKRSDVGRVIDVMTDGTAWTCWHFVESKR